jgi:hypothetical protein
MVFRAATSGEMPGQASPHSSDTVGVTPVSSRFAMDKTPDPRPAGVCHGAHFGEGPVLAILAMLARKSALCVVTGGSAPPNPLRCAPWLGSARSGRESRLDDRTGKPVWITPRRVAEQNPCNRLTNRRGAGSIVVRQCSNRSGAFLDEAIRSLPASKLTGRGSFRLR